MTTTTIDAAPSLAHPRHALWALGFRPFYLLAALQTASMIPLWVGIWIGAWDFDPVFGGVAWHAHEMLFGFVGAVLVGFLYTAVPNWTGRPTPRRGALMALAGLWLAGRIAMLAGAHWPAGLVAAIDVAFLPAAAIGLLPPLIAAKNTRNIAFPFALLGLAGANAAMHLADAGWLPATISPVAIALAIITLILVVITGRVLPMFTRNALPRAGVARWPRIETAALTVTAAALVLSLVRPAGTVTGATSVIAAALILARQIPWRPLATGRHPLLWVLHLGHAWIAVALALAGLDNLGLALPPGIAVHALTAGAVGTLAIGMISRTALGHTGRPMVAGRLLTAAFVLQTGAALLRVLGPVVCPDGRLGAVYELSAVAWSAAFVVYLVEFAPILLRPRIDGRPG